MPLPWKRILPGDRVEAKGLVKATELNGAPGIVALGVNEKGRVGVRFVEGGAVKLLLPKNLASLEDRDPDERAANALAVVEERGVLNASERARVIRAGVRARWSEELSDRARALWSTLAASARKRAILEGGRKLFSRVKEIEDEAEDDELGQLGAQTAMEQIGLLTSRLFESAGHGSPNFACDFIDCVARGTENSVAVMGCGSEEGGDEGGGGGKGEEKEWWDLGVLAEAATSSEATAELSEVSSAAATAATAASAATAAETSSAWLWEGDASSWSELKRNALLPAALQALQLSFARLEDSGKAGALKVLEGTPRKLRRRTELRFYLALRSFYACLFARELVAVVESMLQMEEDGIPLERHVAGT